MPTTTGSTRGQGSRKGTQWAKRQDGGRDSCLDSRKEVSLISSLSVCLFHLSFSSSLSLRISSLSASHLLLTSASSRQEDGNHDEDDEGAVVFTCLAGTSHTQSFNSWSSGCERQRDMHLLLLLHSFMTRICMSCISCTFNSHTHV